jgi:hypothetical protein
MWITGKNVLQTTRPMSNMSLYICPKHFLCDTTLNLENAVYEVDANPLANFLFALEIPETKRQYSKTQNVYGFCSN